MIKQSKLNGFFTLLFSSQSKGEILTIRMPKRYYWRSRIQRFKTRLIIYIWLYLRTFSVDCSSKHSKTGLSLLLQFFFSVIQKGGPTASSIKCIGPKKSIDFYLTYKLPVAKWPASSLLKHRSTAKVTNIFKTD